MSSGAGSPLGRISRVEAIRSRPGNEQCADCSPCDCELCQKGPPEPVWASPELGVLVCGECKTLHDLVTKTSFKDLRQQDEPWTDEEWQRMTETSNATANDIYEHTAPAGYQKPTRCFHRAFRVYWLTSKYIKGHFSSLERRASSVDRSVKLTHTSSTKAALPGYLKFGEKTGYLWKRGRDDDMFQKRWFEISIGQTKAASLTYYTDKNKQNLRGEINLENVHVCVASEEKIRKPNGLQLIIEEERQIRMIYLYAEKEKDMVEWYQAICIMKFWVARHAALDAKKHFNAEEVLHSLNQEVLMEGALHKTDSSGKRSFRRRWFVLHGKNLMYFNNELDANPLKTVKLGSDDCSVSVCQEYPSNYAKGGFPFDLQVPGRKFSFVAGGEQERHSWLQAISRACKPVRQNTTQSIGYIPSRSIINSSTERDQHSPSPPANRRKSPVPLPRLPESALTDNPQDTKDDVAYQKPVTESPTLSRHRRKSPVPLPPLPKSALSDDPLIKDDDGTYQKPITESPGPSIHRRKSPVPLPRLPKSTLMDNPLVKDDDSTYQKPISESPTPSRHKRKSPVPLPRLPESALTDDPQDTKDDVAYQKPVTDSPTLSRHKREYPVPLPPIPKSAHSDDPLVKDDDGTYQKPITESPSPSIHRRKSPIPLPRLPESALADDPLDMADDDIYQRPISKRPSCPIRVPPRPPETPVWPISQGSIPRIFTSTDSSSNDGELDDESVSDEEHTYMMSTENVPVICSRVDSMGTCVKGQGFCLRIPSGALDQSRGEKRFVSVMSRCSVSPPEVTLSKNQAGFNVHEAQVVECRIFNYEKPLRKPLQLEIPHCAIIGDVSQCTVKLWHKAVPSKYAIMYDSESPQWREVLDNNASLSYRVKQNCLEITALHLGTYAFLLDGPGVLGKAMQMATFLREQTDQAVVSANVYIFNNVSSDLMWMRIEDQEINEGSVLSDISSSFSVKPGTSDIHLELQDLDGLQLTAGQASVLDISSQQLHQSPYLKFELNFETTHARGTVKIVLRPDIPDDESGLQENTLTYIAEEHGMYADIRCSLDDPSEALTPGSAPTPPEANPDYLQLDVYPLPSRHRSDRRDAQRKHNLRQRHQPGSARTIPRATFRNLGNAYAAGEAPSSTTTETSSEGRVGGGSCIPAGLKHDLSALLDWAELGNDWSMLARYVGLEHLMYRFVVSPSPTVEFLNYCEQYNISLSYLEQATTKIDRDDAASLIRSHMMMSLLGERDLDSTNLSCATMDTAP